MDLTSETELEAAGYGFVGCGVGRENVVSKGDRGECGEGGMLRLDDLNGWGVIVRLGILN